MAAKAATAVDATTAIDPSEIPVRIKIPLLDSGDSPGKVDQTVMVQCDGKNRGRPLIIQRGVNVEVPAWAFEILVNSGRFPDI